MGHFSTGQRPWTAIPGGFSLGNLGNWVQVFMQNFDGNGDIDTADVLSLTAYWGDDYADWTMGDFDGNGKVGPADAAILAANWGATASPRRANRQTCPSPQCS